MAKRITVEEFFRGRTTRQVVNDLCGEMLGSGQHRDVYECRVDRRYVVKVERDPGVAVFANVTEWRNYMNLKDWRFVGPWLAPCILINQTGQVLLQERVSWEGKRRKDYPLYVPGVFTDLKLGNFGWIGDRFVCCDYAYLRHAPADLRYAKWWGSIKSLKR